MAWRQKMSTLEKSQEKIRINGKQQMIDLLKFMENDERNKLLKNILMRNPIMGRELMEQSFTFSDFTELSDHAIVRALSYVTPTIIGIALKSASIKFQKRVLSLIDRTRAEEAFNYMQRPITNSMRDSQKAQEKIVGVAIALSRKKVINLAKFN